MHKETTIFKSSKNSEPIMTTADTTSLHRTPRFYCLPKQQRRKISMRPIVLALGCTQYKHAKAIANMLIPLLGTISHTLIKKKLQETLT